MFTKREIIFLFCAVILAIISSSVSAEVLEVIEIPLLVFIGVPMVAIIITDPDRNTKNTQEDL